MASGPSGGMPCKRNPIRGAGMRVGLGMLFLEHRVVRVSVARRERERHHTNSNHEDRHKDAHTTGKRIRRTTIHERQRRRNRALRGWVERPVPDEFPRAMKVLQQLEQREEVPLCTRGIVARRVSGSIERRGLRAPRRSRLRSTTKDAATSLPSCLGKNVSTRRRSSPARAVSSDASKQGDVTDEERERAAPATPPRARA